MKLLLTTAFATLLAIGASVSLAATTGNELLSHLKEESSGIEYGYATGFIRGIVESYTIFGLSNQCLELPSGVTAGQTNDVVKKFLEDNPKYRHMSAIVLVRVALERSYATKNQASDRGCE